VVLPNKEKQESGVLVEVDGKPSKEAERRAYQHQKLSNQRKGTIICRGGSAWEKTGSHEQGLNYVI